MLTDVIDDEPLPLPEDKAGRVRVEGDGQVRCAGRELEGAAASNVAPQDPGRDLIAIREGQHVAVADV